MPERNDNIVNFLITSFTTVSNNKFSPIERVLPVFSIYKLKEKNASSALLLIESTVKKCFPHDLMFLSTAEKIIMAYFLYHNV